MRRVLKVSPSGDHAGRHRPESVRAVANRALLAQVLRLPAEHRGRYARLGMRAALRAKDGTARHGHGARLVRRRGICPRAGRRFSPKAGDPEPTSRNAGLTAQAADPGPPAPEHVRFPTRGSAPATRRTNGLGGKAAAIDHDAFAPTGPPAVQPEGLPASGAIPRGRDAPTRRARRRPQETAPQRMRRAGRTASNSARIDAREPGLRQALTPRDGILAWPVCRTAVSCQSAPLGVREFHQPFGRLRGRLVAFRALQALGSR